MTYFDSSVIVAALRSDEAGHEECFEALQRGGYTSTHAMLEAFSILTGGRAEKRLRPADAARLLKRTCEKLLQPVALTWQEVHEFLAEANARGIRGGAIYDYQHLACARKAGTTTLQTLNLADFRAFARPGDPEIKSPA